MNIYKAIIFDMDGTIIDTEKLWAQVNVLYLQRKNIPDYMDIIVRIAPLIHGWSSAKIAALVKKEANITDSVEEILIEKRKIAEELYEEGITYIHGFVDFHNRLKALGVPTAIATNAEPLGFKRMDDALNLKQFFGEHMYHLGDVNYVGKPLPDIYLHAAKKLNIDPKECIAIEDSIHGLCAAREAGMYCIGIDTANLQEKMTPHANLVIKKYSHIPIERLLHPDILTSKHGQN
jgi:beta-phosphoglucomutase